MLPGCFFLGVRCGCWRPPADLRSSFLIGVTHVPTAPGSSVLRGSEKRSNGPRPSDVAAGGWEILKECWTVNLPRVFGGQLRQPARRERFTVVGARSVGGGWDENQTTRTASNAQGRTAPRQQLARAAHVRHDGARDHHNRVDGHDTS